MMNRSIASGLASLVLIGVLAAGSAHGQGDALLQKLVEKGVLSQREANDIRAEMGAEAMQTVEAYNKVKVPTWLDALRWNGDLRLRGEDFSFEDSLKKADRLRFRVRLRLGVEAQFAQWATVGVRLASGDGDPVSANQSLTDTFRKKPVMIDAAYVTLQPPGCDFIKVTGGKMNIPMWQPSFNSPMVYDYDVTPEGVAEQLQIAFGEKHEHRIFANLGEFAVKELSSDANDVYQFDFQGGLEARFGADPKAPTLRATAVGGYFFTDNLTRLKSGDAANLGNTLAANTNNIANIGVVYVRGEVAWMVCPRPFLGTPAIITMSGEYDENLAHAFDKVAVDRGATVGYTGQIAFGEAKKKNQWQVAYQYKYLEADAVWDAITDSDWGNGGTDRKGHVVKALYNLQDWWQLGFTAFITRKISDRPNSGHNTVGVAGEDLLRIEADTVFKF
jgi:hypothetical protein